MARDKNPHTSCFLTQQQAGRYLGHSGNWLRDKAKEHNLYKPSTGKSRQGVACKYVMPHLEIIVHYMIDSKYVSEDDALQAWENYKSRNRERYFPVKKRRSRGSAKQSDVRQ